MQTPSKSTNKNKSIEMLLVRRRESESVSLATH